MSRSQLVCAPDESENNDAKPFPEWKARVVPFVRLRNPTGRGSLILVQFRAQRDRLTRATRLETSFDKVNADTVFRRLDKLTAARMYTRASRPFLALPFPLPSLRQPSVCLLRETVGPRDIRRPVILVYDAKANSSRSSARNLPESELARGGIARDNACRLLALP